MSRPMIEQRRMEYRGREFHFVSYDGLPANVKREQLATEPAWWLMSAGTRWEVMPFHPGRDAEELDGEFSVWLEAHAFQPLDESAG
jgi:hypothetical protein